MKLHSTKAFTLVEVLVGAIILGLISTVCYFAISTLMRVGEMSRNESLAVSLLQKSQEEVRRAASSNFFDSLNQCEFPPSFGAYCGFQDFDQNVFQGFSRTLDVINESGSNELKKSIVTVFWSDFGTKPRQLQSATLIARPSEPEPGNIRGTITAEDSTAVPEGGISITVRSAVGNQNTTISSSSFNDPNIGIGFNFNFKDPLTNNFVLPVGTWFLTTQETSQFFAYTYPVPITIGRGDQVDVVIRLIRKPVPATIIANVIDDNGDLVPNFSDGEIDIYEKAQNWNQIAFPSVRNSNTATYTIPFNNPNITERCFTLTTYYADKTTLSGRQGYAYPTGGTGNPGACQFQYQPWGWSSAVVLDDNGTLNCSNPYWGNSTHGVDRICVSPGDTETVNMRLSPMPTATISGKVVDKSGDPISGATISIGWAYNTHRYLIWSDSNPPITTRSDGSYGPVVVPAIQSMYPYSPYPAADWQFNLSVQASSTVTIQDCCGVETSELRKSDVKYPGPLLVNQHVIVNDLEIERTQQTIECGEIKGRVIDDRDKFGLSNVSVYIYPTGFNTITNGNGDYRFVCPDGVSPKVPIGNYSMTFSVPGSDVVHSVVGGYYPFDTNGNTNYRSESPINVTAGQTTTKNTELWPMGRGNVNITVVDDVTNQVLQGKSVGISRYHGATYQSTNSSGIVTFSNLIETWPPNELPLRANNINHYNLNAVTHRIHVYDPSGIYVDQPNAGTINSLQRGDTQNITIRMNKKTIGGGI